MLVTRQCETGRNTWSSSKLGSVFQNPGSPRMSNFEALPPQPDWREQYSAYPVSGQNGLLHQNFEQSTSSNLADSTPTQEQSSARPTLEHRHTLGPIGQEPESAPVIERPDSAPGDCGQTGANAIRDESQVSTESASISMGSIASNPLSSASSAPAQQGPLVNEDRDILLEPKEEDDDYDDDDDMLDAEDVPASGTPQTAAERRAERRKMKRFR